MDAAPHVMAMPPSLRPGSKTHWIVAGTFMAFAAVVDDPQVPRVGVCQSSRVNVHRRPPLDFPVLPVNTESKTYLFPEEIKTR